MMSQQKQTLMDLTVAAMEGIRHVQCIGHGDYGGAVNSTRTKREDSSQSCRAANHFICCLEGFLVNRGDEVSKIKTITDTQTAGKNDLF
jgi:hypothetical protein